MTNPIIIQMLSKAENQNRARELVRIQQINQAAKSNSNRPNFLAVMGARISRFFRQFLILKSVKIGKWHASLVGGKGKD